VTRKAPGGPKAASRRVKLLKPTQEQIARLLDDAYGLVDFPELLDEPQWRLAALVILQVFIAQNRRPTLRPRDIAAMVDKSIDYKRERGEPLAEAVEAARDAYAVLLGKRRDAVKRAHLRYGKRGVTKDL
jgi:hypothetical protein